MSKKNDDLVYVIRKYSFLECQDKQRHVIGASKMMYYRVLRNRPKTRGGIPITPSFITNEISFPKHHRIHRLRHLGDVGFVHQAVIGEDSFQRILV